MTRPAFKHPSSYCVDWGAEVVGPYRYRLWRVWDYGLPLGLWVMLNPSFADGDKDDLTIVKCVGFSKRENLGGFEVVNLLAYVSTDPEALVDWTWMQGPQNLATILDTASRQDVDGPVIVAWGGHPIAFAPAKRIIPELLKARPDLYCLGQNQDGTPKHPSRLAYTSPLVPFVNYYLPGSP